MRTVLLQRRGRILTPFSVEDLEAVKNFRENEPLIAKISGRKRPRSYQQLKWIHSILTITAANTEDPEWNTLEKAKFSVKVKIRFVKNIRTVNGATFLDLRSFGYDDLDDPEEANQVFNDVKAACAEHLGCDPEELAAQAKKESELHFKIGANG